jgi:hypothetical protein
MPSIMVKERENKIDTSRTDEFPEFLKTCHERIRRFYEYWRSKCAGRRMPARADLDPREMAMFMPGIIIVDVVPDDRRFVYRLVGLREVQLRGRDPSGISVGEAFFGVSAEASLSTYQRVVDTRAPFFQSDPFQTPSGRVNNGEILFLPLSDDGEVANKVIVFTHYFS